MGNLGYALSQVDSQQLTGWNSLLQETVELFNLRLLQSLRFTKIKFSVQSDTPS
jgi:hypothetical protein